MKRDRVKWVIFNKNRKQVQTERTNPITVSIWLQKSSKNRENQRI